ncbi:MAG: SAM-dependent DNA methyltransferase, partial [Actinobacteria bacterium]|nr:SAM-dependent DNA methyltransferase [Actinomycetota bacterium]
MRPKGKLATHADLSALFVVNAVDLYLKPGGTFGFVMPRGVLGGPHYQPFRTGAYPHGRDLYVDFGRPWDLGSVRPHLFPVPACVAFGTRATSGAGPLGATALAWTGTVDPEASADEAASTLETGEVTIVNADDGPQSPYNDDVVQGATFVPRSLVMVVDSDPGPLGVASGQRSVRSRRGGDKKPWADLPDLTGGIEIEFIRPCFLGSSIAPFTLLDPESAFDPWDGQALLTM